MQSEAERIASGLTKSQRRMARNMVEAPMYPLDVCGQGSVGVSLVKRGLAYRAVCTMTATDENFNGYGLTPLGEQVREVLMRPPIR